MKKLTLILLLAIAKIGFAQQDTTLVYSSSPLHMNDPIRSKWRAVVKSEGNFHQVSFYDKKNVLTETISFENEELTVRSGPYMSFENGKRKEIGSYSKGHKNGEWLTYNTSNEELSKAEHFYYGKLDGKFAQYWDNGMIRREGLYENGRKIGNWIFYYADGKLAVKEIFDVYGKKTDSVYFDKEGKSVKYEDLFALPSYKGGMLAFFQYLGKHIRYPSNSARFGIQGTVMLSFTIKKNGTVKDIRVISAPNRELSDEAIRVLELTSDWIPGKMYGEATDVKFNVPIKFSLANKGF